MKKVFCYGYIVLLILNFISFGMLLVDMIIGKSEGLSMSPIWHANTNAGAMILAILILVICYFVLRVMINLCKELK